jgi:uncharacterized protein
MSDGTPLAPQGRGTHAIPLVAFAANQLSASAEFYATVFGWRTELVSATTIDAVAPAGPAISLRADTPAGFPGVVPFIAVPDVQAALTRVVAAGATAEHAPWSVRGSGTLARFADASRTIYGLISATPPDGLPRLPMPVGGTPAPPDGTVCGLEMYARDGAATARFFAAVFGWDVRMTMPRYMAFDPGAGIGGTWQSHTPALPGVAYIAMADVDAALTAIAAAGGTVLGEPMRVTGFGVFGYFTDPSGTSLGIVGR